MFRYLFRKKKIDKKLSELTKEYYRLKHIIEYNEKRLEKLENLEDKTDDILNLIEELKEENKKTFDKLVEVSKKKRKFELDTINFLSR